MSSKRKIHFFKVKISGSPDEKVQKKISEYTIQNPYKLLYASTLLSYKHHDKLVEAVAGLVKQGYPIRLDLLGGVSFKHSLKKLEIALKKFNPNQKDIKYHGFVPFKKLLNLYKEADAFLFSSTCENMPSILVEYMTAGRPIASSNYGPMPEFLQDAGVYYDPVSVKDTQRAILELLADYSQREKYTRLAKEYVRKYSWEKCAKETFSYLENVANSNKNNFY